jgi:protein-L-isoaspartate(D-aspartate) O-methyltransferase
MAVGGKSLLVMVKNVSVLFVFLAAMFCLVPGETVEAAPVGKGGGGTSVQVPRLGNPTVQAARPAFDITTRRDKPPLNSLESYLKWMLDRTTEDKKQLIARWNRAKAAIARKDLTRRDVLEAFLLTPRENFCRAKNVSQAYSNKYLDIGYGQTISGPHLVARMTDELDLSTNDKVLEIGTGSGYQSAMLAELSNYVYTIEVIKPLAEETNAIYEKYENCYPEYLNIKRKVGDGYYGWEEYAPFDRIIVTCGIDHIPPPLLAQLKPNGVMLIPVGPPYAQHVLKVVKRVGADGKTTYEKSDIFNGRVVPFVSFTVDGKQRHSLKLDQPTR